VPTHLSLGVQSRMSERRDAIGDRWRVDWLEVKPAARHIASRNDAVGGIAAGA
jgi:hypothetical protein